MKIIAAVLALPVLAGCATESDPAGKASESPLIFTAKVIEKTGRCHTVQAGRGRFQDDRFAVDRGVLRGIPVGAWVRVHGHSARRQNCPGALRVSVTSLRRIRRPAQTRIFTDPRYRGLALDHCRTYRRNCGGPAAVSFCRRNGYRRAASYSTRPARRTRVHRSGRICRSKGRRVCRRFKVIRCSR